MSAMRLRWRGSRCWTTRMPAGNSAGRSASTLLSAVSPPADAASGTPSKAGPKTGLPAVARAGQPERADVAQERGWPGPQEAQEVRRPPDRQPDADQLARQHELDQVVVGVQAGFPGADGVGDLRPHDALLRPVDDLAG